MDETWLYADGGPCLFCAGAWGDNVRCMAATVPGHRRRALAYAEVARNLEAAVEDLLR